MNNCLNCEIPVKNKYCSNKCQGEHYKKLNPIVEHIVICDNCNKEYIVYETNKQFEKIKKRFCSRSCANSRKWSEDYKKKLSEICKNSEKIKDANKLNFFRIEKEKIKKNCPVCKNDFLVLPCKINKIYCSKECYLKDEHNEFRRGSKGGYRFGSSGRTHSGSYQGYWCDSSWELAFVIYNLDHKIKFERNLQYFKYIHNGKERKYYPDFILENEQYLEIKGYFRDTDILKIEQFPYKLEVMDKIKMKPILKYIKNKYGKNFIELYENVDKKTNKIICRNKWNNEEIIYLKQYYHKIKINEMKFLLNRHSLNSIKSNVKRLLKQHQQNNI